MRNVCIIETPQGVIAAHQAIVTLPSAVLTDGRTTGWLFGPALPEKTAAARGPLGLADKLLSLEAPKV